MIKNLFAAAVLVGLLALPGIAVAETDPAKPTLHHHWHHRHHHHWHHHHWRHHHWIHHAAKAPVAK